MLRNYTAKKTSTILRTFMVGIEGKMEELRFLFKRHGLRGPKPSLGTGEKQYFFLNKFKSKESFINFAVELIEFVFVQINPWEPGFG